jgi:outer membrane lipoprotein carrier protein
MRTRLVLLMILLASGGAAIADMAGQASPSAAELAARIQAHWSTVRDFSADFTLTQSSSLRPVTKVEQGEVRIKKPLMMRWEYSTSGKDQFISDGMYLYAHHRQDRYVVASRLPAEDESSTWLLFLAGRGDLTRDFVPSLPDRQPPDDEWHLALKPVSERPADFSTLTLQVSRASLQFVGLIAEDEQGQTSSYRFANVRENSGLSSREFEFAIPRGVEVKWQR